MIHVRMCVWVCAYVCMAGIAGSQAAKEPEEATRRIGKFTLSQPHVVM